MDFPFPIDCINCSDKHLKCKALSQSKGSCHHCFLNGVKCFFPAVVAVAVAAVMVSTGFGFYPFQCNCFHCTQSYQQCQSDNHCQSQCKHCTKRGLPILYKLSSQGQRNDLEALSVADGGVQSVLLALDDKPKHRGSETIVAEDKRETFFVLQRRHLETCPFTNRFRI
jgi:hypothetical protein